MYYGEEVEGRYNKLNRQQFTHIPIIRICIVGNVKLNRLVS